MVPSLLWEEHPQAWPRTGRPHGKHTPFPTDGPARDGEAGAWPTCPVAHGQETPNQQGPLPQPPQRWKDSVHHRKDKKEVPSAIPRPHVHSSPILRVRAALPDEQPQEVLPGGLLFPRHCAVSFPTHDNPRSRVRLCSSSHDTDKKIEAQGLGDGPKVPELARCGGETHTQAGNSPCNALHWATGAGGAVWEVGGGGDRAEPWTLFQAMLHPRDHPTLGPGWASARRPQGQGWELGMSPPRGSGENSFNPAPLQTVLAAQSWVWRGKEGALGPGEGPWLPRAASRPLHLLGTQGTIHLTGRQATASWRGLKPAGQPLAKALADHSGRASQGLQIQPFSCLANLMVPINFKTHTFPQAPASSAQCSGWRARWEHRQARRCRCWGQPASRTGRSRSAGGGWATEP